MIKSISMISTRVYGYHVLCCLVCVHVLRPTSSTQRPKTSPLPLGWWGRAEAFCSYISGDQWNWPPKGSTKSVFLQNPSKLDMPFLYKMTNLRGAQTNTPTKWVPTTKWHAPKNHCPKNLYKISILQKSCSNDPKKISSTKWRTCKAATNLPT